MDGLVGDGDEVPKKKPGILNIRTNISLTRQDGRKGKYWHELLAIRTTKLAVVNGACEVVEVRTVMDSHADTCVIESSGCVVYDHNITVCVSWYDDQQESQELKIVCTAIAYDNPKEGTVLFLIISQAISIATL